MDLYFTDTFSLWFSIAYYTLGYSRLELQSDHPHTPSVPALERSDYGCALQPMPSLLALRPIKRGPQGAVSVHSSERAGWARLEPRGSSAAAHHLLLMRRRDIRGRAHRSSGRLHGLWPTATSTASSCAAVEILAITSRSRRRAGRCRRAADGAPTKRALRSGLLLFQNLGVWRLFAYAIFGNEL